MKNTCSLCKNYAGFGAISSSIESLKFTLCKKCFRHIQEINENNISDSRYDEFLLRLGGTREIIINRCYGGFCVSTKAKKLYLERMNIPYTISPNTDRHTESLYGPTIVVRGDPYWFDAVSRDDPVLVGVVKDLGDSANGHYSLLKIISIPSDVDWVIEEYDGMEEVCEKHRSWW